METPQEKKAGSRFEKNREILQPGLRAPIPLAANSRTLLQGVFRLFLELRRAPPELVQPAAVTGGGLVHACQELVLGSNRLLSAPREEMPLAVRAILWAVRDILGAENGAYALEQAFPGSGGWGPGSGFERQKDLAAPLERRLEELGLPARMDLTRFAILQVQLDEAYDVASRELQRFYRAVLLQDQDEFSLFARGLSRTVTRELIPEILRGSAPGAEKERPGLFDLLPELERDFD